MRLVLPRETFTACLVAPRANLQSEVLPNDRSPSFPSQFRSKHVQVGLASSGGMPRCAVSCDVDSGRHRVCCRYLHYFDASRFKSPHSRKTQGIASRCICQIGSPSQRSKRLLSCYLHWCSVAQFRNTQVSQSKN